MKERGKHQLKESMYYTRKCDFFAHRNKCNYFLHQNIFVLEKKCFTCFKKYLKKNPSLNMRQMAKNCNRISDLKIKILLFSKGITYINMLQKCPIRYKLNSVKTFLTNYNTFPLPRRCGTSKGSEENVKCRWFHTRFSIEDFNVRKSFYSFRLFAIDVFVLYIFFHFFFSYFVSLLFARRSCGNRIYTQWSWNGTKAKNECATIFV